MSLAEASFVLAKSVHTSIASLRILSSLSLLESRSTMRCSPLGAARICEWRSVGRVNVSLDKICKALVRA